MRKADRIRKLVFLKKASKNVFYHHRYSILSHDFLEHTQSLLPTCMVEHEIE